MRPIYYLLSLTFVQSFSAHAQLERAWNAQGNYYNSSYTNHTLKGSGKAKAIQMMDAVIETFKKHYPEPVGVNVGSSGYVWDEDYSNNKIPYDLIVTISFYDLYKTKSEGTE